MAIYLVSDQGILINHAGLMEFTGGHVQVEEFRDPRFGIVGIDCDSKLFLDVIKIKMDGFELYD